MSQTARYIDGIRRSQPLHKRKHSNGRNQTVIYQWTVFIGRWHNVMHCSAVITAVDDAVLPGHDNVDCRCRFQHR